MPRALTTSRRLTCGRHLLGHEYAVPWGVAPTTLQRAVHPDGELAMARACAAAGSRLRRLQQRRDPVRRHRGHGCRLVAPALPPERSGPGRRVLVRAVDAGARALVLTVDAPVVATKSTAAGPLGLIDPALLRVNFDTDYEQSSGPRRQPTSAPLTSPG